MGDLTLEEIKIKITEGSKIESRQERSLNRKCKILEELSFKRHWPQILTSVRKMRGNSKLKKK